MVEFFEIEHEGGALVFRALNKRVLRVYDTAEEFLIPVSDKEARALGTWLLNTFPEEK